MCGFAGMLGFGSNISEEIVRGMATTLRHRGPDDDGVWLDLAAGVGLGFSRLAILDLSSAGHQPMASASGRYVIVFNGEIYNYLEIRSDLERTRSAGQWRGHSDTETLLAGFDAWGIEATIRKTIGMFAFAAWDRDRRTLTLGRDRLGEKPLYYGRQGACFLFGSELKALRAHPAFKAEVDRNALATFMRHGYIPAPYSIYRGISKLLPGTLLHVAGGDWELAPKPYWSLLDVARDGMRRPLDYSDADALTGLEARLSEAVALQQIADVPLGAFLSGGIDSSTIVALMQAQSSRPVHTFTIGYDEAGFSEAVHTRAVARHLGTDHTDLYVTPEQARAVIPRLPSLYDEPFADSSQIPTFLVSQLARRSVTVSLSGDAGDELFGGYNRYAWTRRLLAIPGPVRPVLAGALRMFSPARWDQVHGAVQAIAPKSLRVGMPGDKAHKLASMLAADSAAAIYQRVVSTWQDPNEIVINGAEQVDMALAWNQLDDFDSPEHRMMLLDGMTYLPDDILAKVDRAAMGVSLETRVPFLDHRVVEYAWRLPLHMKIRNGEGKWLLKQLLYKHVPRELLDRPKMGFGVPIGSWLRGPLREWADDLLSESRLRREGYLNVAPIRQKWVEHLSGRRNWQYHVWNVLMFESWLAEQA